VQAVERAQRAITAKRSEWVRQLEDRAHPAWRAGSSSSDWAGGSAPPEGSGDQRQAGPSDPKAGLTVVLVGLLAGALTTGAWLPQLWQTWRSRSAEDLSWAYLLTIATGFAAWLAYGLLAGDVAVVATNVVTLLLVLGLIGLKHHTS
jgi:MtN3 and saliva related transmembrane protein